MAKGAKLSGWPATTTALLLMGGGFICKTSYRAGTIYFSSSSNLLFKLCMLALSDSNSSRISILMLGRNSFAHRSFSFSKVKLISKIYLLVWPNMGKGCLMSGDRRPPLQLSQ